MARARNLKPSLFKNELLGTADPLITILFQGLWTLADRNGRLEDRPLRIKAEVLPYRDGFDVAAGLDWLVANGFITRYESQGLKCIHITKFLEHQKPHKHEPVCPGLIPTTDAKPVRRATTKPGRATEKGCSETEDVGTRPASSSPPLPVSLSLGSLIPLSSEPGSPDTEPDAEEEDPVVMEFPVVGEGGDTWPLRASKVAEYVTSFPAVDVVAECRKARQWCIDSPQKRKTFGGMAKFLGGWLGRCQDRGGASPALNGKPDAREEYAAFINAGKEYP